MNCVLVAVNVRSSHNVGSFFRTCDGLGVDGLYLTGITPYPTGLPDDVRLPHVAEKAEKDIHKTALGAEKTLTWTYHPNTMHVLEGLKEAGWELCALEQAINSTDLTMHTIRDKVALIVGNEVDGLPEDILDYCNKILEIPMQGNKESFNVSVAAGMALFWIKNNWTIPS